MNTKFVLNTIGAISFIVCLVTIMSASNTCFYNQNTYTVFSVSFMVLFFSGTISSHLNYKKSIKYALNGYLSLLMPAIGQILYFCRKYNLGESTKQESQISFYIFLFAISFYFLLRSFLTKEAVVGGLAIKLKQYPGLYKTNIAFAILLAVLALSYLLYLYLYQK